MGRYPPAMLTSETFRMLEQMTLWDTNNATSSPASAAGGSHCAPPAGPTTEKCGQDHAPASHSAPLASAAAQPMRATCGHSGATSLRSAALQQSLESRLREAVDLNGSPEFGMTWKHKAMPWGAPIFRLAASQRHRNASESGLLPWATPKASDGEKASALSKARQAEGRQPDCLPGQVRPWLGLTAKDGALSQESSRWVMGYPIAWSSCAATATPLFQQ